MIDAPERKFGWTSFRRISIFARFTERRKYSSAVVDFQFFEFSPAIDESHNCLNSFLHFSIHYLLFSICVAKDTSHRSKGHTELRIGCGRPSATELLQKGGSRICFSGLSLEKHC
jgi:hypothetical protein